MPTRILSWLQMVREADPQFTRTSLQPWVYEFSNGRLFIDRLPLYGTNVITDDFGNVITDDFGTPIQSDSQQPLGGGFVFGQSGFGTGTF